MSNKLLYTKNVKKKYINGKWYAFRKSEGSWSCICSGDTESELRRWVSFSLPHPNVDVTASD